MAQMRIETLRSAVEAAGVTMAPSADQFDGEPEAPVETSAASYLRSWAGGRSRDHTAAKLKAVFNVRWPRALSTG
jgi:hypothetical protein